MSKYFSRDLIMLIVMIVIFGIMYMIATWSQNHPWCVGRDKYICKALTHMKSHLGGKSQGTFTKGDTMKVSWGIYNDTYQYTYVVNAKEVMQVIGTQDNIYIRDYSDNRWWKQPIKQVEQYSIQLPFEPQSYIQKIATILLDKKTLYTFKKVTTCQEKTCRNYHVTNKSIGVDMDVSIDTKKNTLIAFEIENSGTVESVTVQYDHLTQINPPTDRIKIASSTQNIFLDMLYQLQPKKNEVPYYVELIEQQRKRAEEQGDATDVPRYVAPEPTTP